jgi:hypothetical protein
MVNQLNQDDLELDTSQQSRFLRQWESQSSVRDTFSVPTAEFVWDLAFTFGHFETCHISQLHTEGMHSESLIRHIDEIFEKESMGLYPWNMILRRPSSQDAVNVDEWWNIEASRNQRDNAIINAEVIDYDEDRDTSGVFISQDK